MELYNESSAGVSSTSDSTFNCSDDSFTSASGSGELVSSVVVDDDNDVLLRSIESRWRDNQLHTSLIIDRVVTPVWYVVGIAGNMVSARIWLGRGMRRNNSSAIYLATLSINDTLFLFLHVWQELKYAWSQRTVDYPVVCELFALVYLVTQYLAPTLVLGFTVERFIAICYPYQKIKYCTAGRAVKVVAAMILVCFLIGCVQPYLWTYDAATGQCTVRYDPTSGGFVSLWDVWSWSTEMLIFLIVPLVILAVNVLVMREVWRMSVTNPLVTGTGSSLSAAGLGSPTGSLVVARSASVSPHTAGVGRLLVSAPPSPPPYDHQRQDQRTPTPPTTHQCHQSRMSPRFNRFQPQTLKHQKHHHGGSSAATNAMLLSVSFYVIFTTLPATLVYVLATAFPEGHVRASLVQPSIAAATAASASAAAASPCGAAAAAAVGAAAAATATAIVSADEEWTRYVVFATVRNIVNEICLSHYACNFFLFFVTGREFRAAVRRTFCCRRESSASETASTEATFRQSMCSREYTGGPGRLQRLNGGNGVAHQQQRSTTTSGGVERTLLTAV